MLPRYKKLYSQKQTKIGRLERKNEKYIYQEILV